MGYILIIIIILALWGLHWLRRHPDILMRWMARRIQKQFTRQGGEQSGQDRRRQQQRRESYTRRSHGRKEPIIPPEYAQDVEFTESRIYSSDTEVRNYGNSSGATSVENQVSDVEWEEVEIKHSRK